MIIPTFSILPGSWKFSVAAGSTYISNHLWQKSVRQIVHRKQYRTVRSRSWFAHVLGRFFNTPRALATTFRSFCCHVEWWDTCRIGPNRPQWAACLATSPVKGLDWMQCMWRICSNVRRTFGLRTARRTFGGLPNLHDLRNGFFQGVMLLSSWLARAAFEC